jgi:hemoglobin-like flavoprotein
MTMTPDQAVTVRRTFRLVEAIQEQVAVLFYRRLFVLDPDIAFRFDGTDMDRQRKILIRTLASVVDGLDEPVGTRSGAVAPDPGPAILGPASEDDDIAGSALTWTLAQALGPAFTPEVEAAWRAAFGVPAARGSAANESDGFRRLRRPAASSSRASDTPRSTLPAQPA